MQGSLLSVLVCSCELLLTSEKCLPGWKELPVEIVEDDVLSRRVPFVEIEHSVEVHGLAKRSCPLSLPQS